MVDATAEWALVVVTIRPRRRHSDPCVVHTKARS